MTMEANQKFNIAIERQIDDGFECQIIVTDVADPRSELDKFWEQRMPDGKIESYNRKDMLMITVDENGKSMRTAAFPMEVNAANEFKLTPYYFSCRLPYRVSIKSRKLLMDVISQRQKILKISEEYFREKNLEMVKRLESLHDQMYEISKLMQN